MQPLLLGKKWPIGKDVGLQAINRGDFNGRLYSLSKVNSFGVPSFFAHPFAFSKKLENGDATAFELFSILIKGIFLGVVKLKSIDNVGLLGDAAKNFKEGGGSDSFIMLYYEGIPIGGLYPESLVFPAILLDRYFKLSKIKEEGLTPEEKDELNSLKNHWEQVLRRLQQKIDEEERKFGKDILAYSFKEWADQRDKEIVGDTQNPNRPVWLNKILNVADNWTKDYKKPADIGYHLKILPSDKTKVIDLNNEITQIPLVRFVQNPIVCITDVGQINLTEKEEVLRLGPGKKILCTVSTTSNGFLCPDCPKNGEGPIIEEKGFFERSPGQYIIWNIPDIPLPSGCTGIEYITGVTGGAILKFGRLKVEVRGKVLTKDDILCKRVIRFENVKIPDLPVKLDYVDCVSAVSPTDSTYQIKLKGVDRRIPHTPEFIQGDEASILLWPSFTADDWKVNYFFFHGSKGFNDLKPFLRLRLKSGSITEPFIPPDVKVGMGGCKTDSPITHVEVLRETNGERENVGIFKDTRIPAPGKTTVYDLSLDFGTSNTSLAIEHNGIRELEIKDETIDLLDKHYDKNLIHKNSWWLPTYIPPEVSILKSIPSELIFRDKFMRSPESLPDPLAKYTIPHPLFFRIGAEAHITTNFKWEAYKPFRGREEDTVKAYLKTVMLMALAFLRKDYLASGVNLIATYPLAFGSKKRDNYREWLETILSELGGETGMTVEFKTTHTAKSRRDLVAESDAGIARSAPTGAAFVVDIGGGTTDIALTLLGRKFLAVDSIKYAGNVYINYLATKLFPDMLEKESACRNIRDEVEKIQCREIYLQRQIRNKGIGNGVFEKYRDKPSRDTAQLVLAKFFDGLFEYLCRILHANKLTDNVTLYPIGNGWMLLEGLGIDNIRTHLKNKFRERGITLDVTISQTFTMKGAVATGALEAVRNSDYIPHYIPRNLDEVEKSYESVGSIVGGKVKIKWSDGEVLTEPNHHVPYKMPTDNRDVIEFDTMEFIDSLPFSPKDTPKKEVADRLNRACRDYLGTHEGKLSLTRSIFTAFLEEVYREYYL